MSRFTDILIDWKGGWRGTRKASADVRWEVCQTHPGDIAQVLRRAHAELLTYGNGQVEHTVGVDIPEGDPVPGIDYLEGSRVDVDGSTLTLEAFTFTLDDDTGRWVDVPQFGTVFDTPSDRMARAVGSIGGLTAGTSKLARPRDITPPPDVRPLPGGGEG